MKSYGSACVCENGHVISSSIEMDGLPSSFCVQCGKKALTACECGNRIRGGAGRLRRRTSNLYDRQTPDVFIVDGGTYLPPSFCDSCGAAFPWTRRLFEVADDVAATLDPAEAEEFKRLFGVLGRGEPGAEASAKRIGQLLKNAPPVVVGVLKDLAVNILANCCPNGGGSLGAGSTGTQRTGGTCN